MIQTFGNLLQGFIIVFTFRNLMFCFAGVLLGIIIGALPGIGPTAGIAIVLPVTFGLDPTAGIILVSGIYYGAMYGGAITSILLNTPGDSAAIMTTLDGHPLAKKGRAGQALGMAAFASIIGGSISIIAFTFLAPIISRFALAFGPPEYFALTFMGLTTVASLTGDRPIKGYISALIGLFIAVIGFDIVQGTPRFIFGNSVHMMSGIHFVPVAMGLFGLSELFDITDEVSNTEIDSEKISWKDLLPNKEDWKFSTPHLLRGSGIGFFIGMLPGAGATIASFLSYGAAKKTSKRGYKFGTGVIEGVAAPESANSAASIGAMVPMITLGIPGSGATAMMLGALMMFGLTPGPLLMKSDPDFVWGLISSLYVANIILLILSILFLPLFIKILKIPTGVLNALIISFILIGSFSLNNSMFDVKLTVFFALIGFVMKRLSYPIAPLVLSLVLGGMLENSLRQSLIMLNGNLLLIFKRPIAGIIIGFSIIAIIWPFIKGLLIALAIKKSESR